MSFPDRNDPGAQSGASASGISRVELLESIRSRGRVWSDLAAQYGVTNPDPPWKVTLEATCDGLSAEACALPLLERRAEEDELSAALYAGVPYPERQLLALAHSMISRGVFKEDELARHMEQVHERLTKV